MRWNRVLQPQEIDGSGYVSDSSQVVPSSSGQDVSQGTAYAWFVVVILSLAFAFSYMDRSILPLVIQPIEHSLGISDTTIALLQGAAFAIFYSLFGFPLARAADRGNRRNLILIGLVAWSAATIGCGLARNTPELFLARVCVAIGEAVLAPAAVSIISDYFSPSQRTRALTIYSMGVFLGGGLSLGAGGTLLRTLHAQGGLDTPFGFLESWRIVFLTLGAASILLMPFLLFVAEPKRRSDDGASVGQPHTIAEVLHEFGRKRRALFACIIGFATIAMGAQTVQVWAPTLLSRAHGWALGGIGQGLGALTVIFGILGALSGAALSERLERSGREHGKLLVGFLSAMICVVSSWVVTLSSGVVAFGGVVATLYFVAFNFGIVQAALAQLLPNRMRAVGTACYIAAANLLAATLGPLLVGLVNDHVFHDPNMIAISVRCVAPIAFIAAAAILISGMRSYRAAVATTNRN